MKERAIALLFFLAIFGFYLHQAAPTVTPGDSGEFMTAAATLSIPHAPSYPLYTILGKVFISILSWAQVPYRLNVLSAFFSSLSLLLIFFIFRKWGADLLTALLMALAIGFSTSFWLNSLVTEVFALNSFFVCLLLWSMLVEKNMYLFSFLLGLGMGNHQILIFMIPAAFASFFRERILFKTPSFVSKAALFFLLGFSIYLVLPIRSMKEPPLNWGQPKTAEKLYRAITRKDYGSFNLATGEMPERSIQNSLEQLKRFVWQLNLEIPWAISLLGFLGLCVGWKKNEPWALPLLFLFVFSGPFFFLLSNLPMTFQSEGIMGRFLVMPSMAILCGLVFLTRMRPRIGKIFLGFIVCVLFARGFAAASCYRMSFLVWDYAQSMLRTLPAHAALFMDGGDDAFYSLAMTQNVLKLRPDLEFHDRGGLVFKNIYGDDFRSLSKEEKTVRRFNVESKYLKHRPVFYSSMDFDLMSGVSISQAGFLLQAAGDADGRMTWPLLILRSIYPFPIADYRHRALACFFPFMNAKSLAASGQLEDGLKYYRRSLIMGRGVDWLKTNVDYDLAHLGFQYLQNNQLAQAERVYLEMIKLDSHNFQAQSNLGVVYERQGRFTEAVLQYQSTAKQFPHNTDPVYNLAVYLWSKKDWEDAKACLEEVLRRDPTHLQAQKFLGQLNNRMNNGKPR